VSVTANGTNQTLIAGDEGWYVANDFTLAPGTNTFIGTIADMAGNVGAATNLVVETTAVPQCMVTNLSGGVFTNTNLTLSISNYDAWCGFAKLYIFTNGASLKTLTAVHPMTNLTYNLPTTVTNLQVWCVDNAGNTSATNNIFYIPAPVITNLTNGQDLSNLAAVCGTNATADIASVWLSVNGGAYSKVSGTTGWSSNDNLIFWTNLTWTNTISVYALNSAGVSSATNVWSNLTVDYYSTGLVFILNADNASYTVSGGSAAVGAVVIPYYCAGLPVTCIGVSAFNSYSGVTNISIPSCVTNFGNGAFSYCTGLTNLVLPSSLTSIGSECFLYCAGLTNLVLPSSLTSIGVNGFADCTGLVNLIIPSGIGILTDFTFVGCTNLTNIILPNALQSIAAECFDNCSNLQQINLPTSLVSIGVGAFGSCCLKSITIPSSVTSIGALAFAGCVNLVTVYENSSTPPTAGNSIFSGCSSLSAIYVPSFTAEVSFDLASGWSSYSSIIEL
jgi:hypothetical protein